jgi:hypothetical protein
MPLSWTVAVIKGLKNKFFVIRWSSFVINIDPLKTRQIVWFFNGWARGDPKKVYLGLWDLTKPIALT